MSPIEREVAGQIFGTVGGSHSGGLVYTRISQVTQIVTNENRSVKTRNELV